MEMLLPDMRQLSVASMICAQSYLGRQNTVGVGFKIGALSHEDAYSPGTYVSLTS